MPVLPSSESAAHLGVVHRARSHWIVLSDCAHGDDLIRRFAVALLVIMRVPDDGFHLGQFRVIHPVLRIDKTVTFLTLLKSRVRKSDMETLLGVAQGRPTHLNHEQDLLPLTFDDPLDLMGMYEQLVTGKAKVVPDVRSN